MSVLRVTDGRTHHLVELPALRRGVLRMCVHLSCPGLAIGAADLRALLVGDVLFRAAETAGVQARHTLNLPHLPPEQVKALDRATAALGINPPAADGMAAADVHVSGTQRSDTEHGVWIEVGPVRQRLMAVPGLHEGAVADPLALRLALLSHPHREPIPLTSRMLTDAEQTLTLWRDRVADWARSPSRPIPDDIRCQARTALADGLSTPRVLAVLRHVAARREIPDGAKFEVFAYLDRVLGLDLVRDVGRT
ncbi:hypothetical protein SSP35_14_01090 [Streptomyces sp. NBRC 110611]|uniref:hypothetical protein n=1 Tax=Streptomyces sp. NBRC 110611 TaxID=1621259 RepID=UPI0008560A58|nr:hypothetical protein [Streptomyces sp. NBRC 110611]GAU69775.1 hypothetical protein SSP35_14_01090 [Streptomyces sp. NBRC 110611]